MSEELVHEHNESNRAAELASLPDVKLTPKAIEMVRKMHSKEGLGAEQGLRIGVVRNPLQRGCRGPRRSHMASVPALASA